MEGVGPEAVRAVQSFISVGTWDEERLLHRHCQEVERARGTDDGVLMVEGRDFPKQGCHSAGVKWQYGGARGQRASRQAGICVGYVNSQGYPRLDRRLYLPSEWITDDAYAERRRSCGMPPAIMCKTKPELAAEMLTAVVKSQRLQCRWVVADEAFGCAPDFLDGVARWGLWYVAERPHTTRVWGVRPVQEVATPLATPVRLRGMRWPIETCFEDGQHLVRIGDDEVRSWAGWHHHLTLVILAHFLVLRLHLRFKKSARRHATAGRAAVNGRPAPARI